MLRLPSFRTLILIAIATLLSAPVAWAQAHLWSHRFGDTSSDRGEDVAVDGSGNVIVTGFFGGTVDFGGGPLTSAGSLDIFVVKFDSNGNHLWSRRFGDASNDFGNGVAVDGSGNVIVTGFFGGTVDFGGVPLTSAGSLDIFVVKFDSNGNHLWSKRFGDTSGNDSGEGVTVDGSGNVILTGNFAGTIDFGGGALTSTGTVDLFVAKFASNGSHVWSQQFGTTANFAFGGAVATDGSENIIATGFYFGALDLGGGLLTSAGAADIFVAKFAPTGSHLWSQSFGNGGTESGRDVAVDGSGSILVTGSFTSTVDFGGGPLTSAGSADMYVVKFDLNGSHLWSQRFGNSSFASSNSVAIDAAENVLIAGEFFGTVDFGGGPVVSTGARDIFVAKFDSNGNHMSSQNFGGFSTDRGEDVAVDGLGNVILTGEFRSTVDFGGGPLASVGLTDIFVAKYSTDPAALIEALIADVLALVDDGTLQEQHANGLIAKLEEALKKLEQGHTQPASNKLGDFIDQGAALVNSGKLSSAEGQQLIDAASTIIAVLESSDATKVTVSEGKRILPTRFALGQNSPNPFNPMTTIRLTLGRATAYSLSIYDVGGRLVRRYQGTGGPGEVSVTWDGTDDAGAMVSSGLYFYRAQAGTFTETKRMVLLK